MKSCVSSKKYNFQILEKKRFYENFKRSQIEVRELRAKNLTITEEYLKQDEKRKFELKAIEEMQKAYKQDSLISQKLLSDADNKIKELMYLKMELTAHSTHSENQISELNMYIKKQNSTMNLLTKKLVSERRYKKELMSFIKEKLKEKKSFKAKLMYEIR